jgi:N-methylhydantoinase A
MRMIGIDVGGTFTDIVFYDEQHNELRWAKAASSPANPAAGVFAAIGRSDVDLRELDLFVHGVTIGTNAILERKGAPVWLITTRGFKDTLEVARTNRTVLYDIKTLKPPPLVDRRHIIEIDERILASGAVLRPMDVTQITAAVQRLRAETPAALVICFLHSYANPQHEEEAARVLRAQLPSWFICNSAEVLPEVREYERFSTAVINGYIGPIMERYLTALESLLRAKGYSGELFLMISSGGIVTARRAARFPVQTVLSGPAGGVAAALHFGELLGLRNLITYDMGGTSTDVCLIDDLNPPVGSDHFIEGYPIRTPQIDIHSIGAGGGSIAWVDTGRILNVGPRSAGASPGPACYGTGGTEATVTDANLVLRRLSPRRKLAGSIEMSEQLAQRAVGRVAAALTGLDTVATAEGIVRVAIARMVSAIKEISITRGYDPRDFVLLAYGGAGPMHAALIADELDITQIVVPPRPGNFSAFGALISNIRHDYLRSVRVNLQTAGLCSTRDDFEQLEASARSAMIAEGIPAEKISVERACRMRYVGQSWDLTVRIPSSTQHSRELKDLFHRAHERRYGYRLADSVEVVGVCVSAIGEIEKPRLPEWTAAGDAQAALLEWRSVYFAGKSAPTPIYDRDRLARGTRIAGPALIEEMGSVTVVPQQWTVEVGKLGELHLSRDHS